MSNAILADACSAFINSTCIIRTHLNSDTYIAKYTHKALEYLMYRIHTIFANQFERKTFRKRTKQKNTKNMQIKFNGFENKSKKKKKEDKKNKYIKHILAVDVCIILEN